MASNTSKVGCSMLEPCQRCGAQTSVLLFDDFSLRKLCRACFGELVEPNHVPQHSVGNVHVRGLKEVDSPKHVIEK